MSIARCPDCGKVISLSFPLHDCTPRNPDHNRTPAEMVGTLARPSAGVRAALPAASYRVLPATTSNALMWGRVMHDGVIRSALVGSRNVRSHAAAVLRHGSGFLCALAPAT